MKSRPWSKRAAWPLGPKLFNGKDVSGWCENCLQAIGFPQLGPWVRVEGPEEEVVTRRNPYYFAVDADGNQLPYLDGRRAVINQWGNHGNG